MARHSEQASVILLLLRSLFLSLSLSLFPSIGPPLLLSIFALLLPICREEESEVL